MKIDRIALIRFLSELVTPKVRFHPSWTGLAKFYSVKMKARPNAVEETKNFLQCEILRHSLTQSSRQAWTLLPRSSATMDDFILGIAIKGAKVGHHNVTIHSKKVDNSKLKPVELKAGKNLMNIECVPSSSASAKTRLMMMSEMSPHLRNPQLGPPNCSSSLPTEGLPMLRNFEFIDSHQLAIRRFSGEVVRRSVGRDEFCSLLLSRRTMERCDDTAAHSRGLFDSQTGELFGIRDFDLYSRA